jgi:hypothetical protein
MLRQGPKVLQALPEVQICARLWLYEINEPLESRNRATQILIREHKNIWCTYGPGNS